MPVCAALRRRPRRNDEGALALEAALVFPFLLLLLLGIIELSLLARDHVAVTSATRAAVRLAAGEVDAGRCTPSPSPAPGETPCPAGQVPVFAQLAADAVARSATGLPKESLQSLMVFKANDAGFPGALDDMPLDCSAVSDCVVYRWVPDPAADKEEGGAFTYASGTWDSSQIQACFPTRVDRVGVRLQARHRVMSGFMPWQQTMTIEDSATMNVEPLDPSECGAGQHP